MINIDLHIHSYASKYKEAKDVVEMSTVALMWSSVALYE
jgi:hypothetical protein